VNYDEAILVVLLAALRRARDLDHLDWDGAPWEPIFQAIEVVREKHGMTSQWLSDQEDEQNRRLSEEEST